MSVSLTQSYVSPQCVIALRCQSPLEISRLHQLPELEWCPFPYASKDLVSLQWHLFFLYPVYDRSPLFLRFPVQLFMHFRLRIFAFFLSTIHGRLGQVVHISYEFDWSGYCLELCSTFLHVTCV